VRVILWSQADAAMAPVVTVARNHSGPSRKIYSFRVGIGARRAYPPSKSAPA
jgi:hypothetical protein